MKLLKWLIGRKPALNKTGVSSPLTPFGESIKLLRELTDLQKEQEKTMRRVYDFLNKWEDNNW